MVSPVALVAQHDGVNRTKQHHQCYLDKHRNGDDFQLMFQTAVGHWDRGLINRFCDCNNYICSNKFAKVITIVELLLKSHYYFQFFSTGGQVFSFEWDIAKKKKK